jgi:hypothetical protein
MKLIARRHVPIAPTIPSTLDPVMNRNATNSSMIIRVKAIECVITRGQDGVSSRTVRRSAHGSWIFATAADKKIALRKSANT